MEGASARRRGATAAAAAAAAARAGPAARGGSCILGTAALAGAPACGRPAGPAAAAAATATGFRLGHAPVILAGAAAAAARGRRRGPAAQPAVLHDGSLPCGVRTVSRGKGPCRLSGVARRGEHIGATAAAVRQATPSNRRRGSAAGRRAGTPQVEPAPRGQRRGSEGHSLEQWARRGSGGIPGPGMRAAARHQGRPADPRGGVATLDLQMQLRVSSATGAIDRMCGLSVRRGARMLLGCRGWTLPPMCPERVGRAGRIA